MFKQTFYTALLTSIFVATPAMAGDKTADEATNHPATEMEDSRDPRAGDEMKNHAEKYKEDRTDNEDSKPSRERLKDAETSQHPAHEMGEGDELEERGN